MTTAIRHHFVQTHGIRMHVAEAGEGFPVVLCHGFPELWFSWRHQLRALAEAGFRAIAPDMRGYGDTDAPEDPALYTAGHTVAVIVGLLDELRLPKAVIVGHDWGGLTSWYFGLLHPERTERLVGLNTPFLPPGPAPTHEALRAAFGLPPERFYMSYFQKPGVAEAELSSNVREGFKKLMRSAKYARDLWTFVTVGGDGSGVLARIGPGETFLTEEELDVYEQAFTRTGFRGGLNWYRASEANWRESKRLTSFRIDAPSMMITAAKDPILRPEMAEPMRQWVPNLRMERLETSHWTQQERPDEVNALLLDFLSDLRRP